jgi:ribosomal protein RSM22 (predicted rRNA methylase)
VLQETKARVPDLRIETMLDLGAGPGTAMWAAAEIFPDLSRVALVERDEDWIILGKGLTTASRIDAIRAVHWEQGSVTGQLPTGRFDLVAMSYVLNEVAAGERIAAVRTAWERTGSLLLIAEPGTSVGFENIRELRRDLISLGAHIVAPCPHGHACPMEGGNWCHFAERLRRSSLHRVAKSAELGYEDEKYSYVVFSRAAVRLPDSRVLRHPRKHSGHVELELCTPEGLKRETISRKSGDKYKQARKSEWGDAW